VKYETQKIAYNYFVAATLLFGLQVVFGLIIGAKYVWDMDYLTTQGYMKLWYAVFWTSGWLFFTGVMAYVIDFFGIGKRAQAADQS
jgi:hypothetical protein